MFRDDLLVALSLNINIKIIIIKMYLLFYTLHKVMQCHSILMNKKQLTDKAIGCFQCSSVAKQHHLLFMSLERFI